MYRQFILIVGMLMVVFVFATQPCLAVKFQAKPDYEYAGEYWADLDGDGQCEILVGFQDPDPYEGDYKQAYLEIWQFVDKRWQKIKTITNEGVRFEDEGYAPIGKSFWAEDLDADGKLEIIFVNTSYGGSDSVTVLRIFRPSKTKQGWNFTEIEHEFGRPSHSTQGAFKIGDFLKDVPGKEIIETGFIWEKGEAHYDLHYYYIFLYGIKENELIHCQVVPKTKYKYDSFRGGEPLLELSTYKESLVDIQLSGKIAFIREGNIWIADSSGCNQKQLTFDGGDKPFTTDQYLNACWISKDKILFLKGRQNFGGTVGVVDLQGKIKTFPQYPQVAAIGFNPSKKQILILRPIPPTKENFDLWLGFLDLDGKKLSAQKMCHVRICDGFGHHISLSPNGNQIALGILPTDVSPSLRFFDLKQQKEISPYYLDYEWWASHALKAPLFECALWDESGQLYLGAAHDSNIYCSGLFHLSGQFLEDEVKMIWYKHIRAIAGAKKYLLLTIGQAYQLDSSKFDIWLFDPSTQRSQLIIFNGSKANWIGQ